MLDGVGAVSMVTRGLGKRPLPLIHHMLIEAVDRRINTGGSGLNVSVL